MTIPVRLPDAASLGSVLAGLNPASADADLVPALARAFPGFEFSVARIDDDYWRDTRSVIRPDDTRLGELRPKGERDVGFIPRPLKPPKERLLMTPEASVHALMDRIEAVDREVGLPFGWFFLMTHGHWVDPDVGLAIAHGLKAQRVRLSDPDARVLLRWADKPYGF